MVVRATVLVVMSLILLLSATSSLRAFSETHEYENAKRF